MLTAGGYPFIFDYVSPASAVDSQRIGAGYRTVRHNIRMERIRAQLFLV
jgi:hypothetical protein